MNKHRKTRKPLLAILLTVALLLIAMSALTFAESVQHGGNILYTEPVKSVLFSHKLHVEERGLGCEMCHSGIFEMSALDAQKKPDFTMKGLSEGKYCGSCHAKDGMAFSSNTQCGRCHGGVKEYNRATGKDESKSEHSAK